MDRNPRINPTGLPVQFQFPNPRILQFSVLLLVYRYDDRQDDGANDESCKRRVSPGHPSITSSGQKLSVECPVNETSLKFHQYWNTMSRTMGIRSMMMPMIPGMMNDAIPGIDDL